MRPSLKRSRKWNCPSDAQHARTSLAPYTCTATDPSGANGGGGAGGSGGGAGGGGGDGAGVQVHVESSWCSWEWWESAIGAPNRRRADETPQTHWKPKAQLTSSTHAVPVPPPWSFRRGERPPCPPREASLNVTVRVERFLFGEGWLRSSLLNSPATVHRRTRTRHATRNSIIVFLCCPRPRQGRAGRTSTRTGGGTLPFLAKGTVSSTAVCSRGGPRKFRICN